MIRYLLIAVALLTIAGCNGSSSTPGQQESISGSPIDQSIESSFAPLEYFNIGNLTGGKIDVVIDIDGEAVFESSVRGERDAGDKLGFPSRWALIEIPENASMLTVTSGTLVTSASFDDIDTSVTGFGIFVHPDSIEIRRGAQPNN